MSWTRNGEDIVGVDEGTEPAPWGGKISKTSLQITPTSKDNGVIYACKALNSVLVHAISDAVTMNVICKHYSHLNVY